MIKSLTGIRLLLVFIVSIVTVLAIDGFVGKPLEILANLSFIFVPFLVYSEVGRVVVGQLAKKQKVSFLGIVLALVVIAFLIKIFLFNYLNAKYLIVQPGKVKFFAIGVVTISTYLILFFWVKKNNNESVNLLKSKQTYLQHSFNALKSQNVIAFLQESLNISAKTIDRDPKDALLQIEKLTMILRYLLQSRDERFVKLGAEIKNASLYCELVELQLKKHVNLQFNIPAEFNNTQVPPLVFQLVLENQIKQLNLQNEATFEIEVYIENNKFVVVKTNARKTGAVSVQTNQFLNNLKQQYQLYNKAAGVAVLATKSNYLVKFPLVAE